MINRTRQITSAHQIKCSSFTNQLTIPFSMKKLFFGVLVLCSTFFASAQQKVTSIYFKSGEFAIKNNMDPEKIRPAIQKAKYGSNYYTLLAFTQAPTSSQITGLKQQGIELLAYLPDHCYQVRMRTIPSLSYLYTLGVRAMFTLPGQLKISRELQLEMEHSVSTDRPILINLQLFPGVNWLDVEPILTFYGITVTKTNYRSQGLVQVQLPSGSVGSVADLPFVASLNISNLEPQLLNQRERGLFGLGNLTSNQNAGRNLSGLGVTIGIGDDADPTFHLDHSVNVENRNPSFITTSHGCRVAGIAGGDGIIEERYRGVAPNSFLIADFFDYVITKAPIYVADYGMSVTNNSYYIGLANCPGNSLYNELSVYADQQLYNQPYLQHIFAAGNDGTLTCSPFPLSFGTIKSGYQTAKNVLTVGNFSYLANNVFSGSSRGPVSDGRIKPELVANGRNVISTITNNTYTAGTGTSFSAPFVTGVWSLLTERYQQLHGLLPKSGLLKAALCNSSDDRGQPGPDYSWGFGLVNPRRAVEMIEQAHYYSSTITTGATHLQSINVPAGTRQVKVMLYWHDKEGSTLASTALVNDLDMSVTDGSNNYKPWILNPAPAFVQSNATRGVDRLNNIEQVTIDNPGSLIEVAVNGFNVPYGPQEFFVTYEFIKDEIILESPYGGERFAPGQEEIIRWTANDNSTNTFKIEFSADNGSTWTVLANTSASNSYLSWTVPNTPTNQGKIRVSRNGGGATATTPGKFTILGQPSLTTSVPCEGYVDLSWPAVTSATNYEVMQLINGTLSSVATTTGTTYRAKGLNRNERYWFTVRAILTDSLGMRATAKSVIPALNTPCTASDFDNDLKIDTVLAPANARKFTNSALSSTQNIQVRIKNLDNISSSTTYSVSYRVNNGTLVTEIPGTTITAGGTTDFTFASTYDFSAPGTYTLEVIVKQTGDLQPQNDTLKTTFKHIANTAVVLPFIETFESTGNDTYTSNAFGMNNADHFDFNTTGTNGRLRTFVNTGIAINGQKAATLDARQFNGLFSDNQLIATINLSNYIATTNLRLDFRYKNHGQLKQPPAGVWARGNESLPWVQIYDFSNNDDEPGSTRQISYILNQLGQPVSSSFQLKFEQKGTASANNGDYNSETPDRDDGMTFDDIHIAEATNDLRMAQVVAPQTLSCTASGTTAVTVKVENTSGVLFNNVPVFYRIDNGPVIGELMPTLTPGASTNYTFATTCDLSAYKKYTLETWVRLPSDDYQTNDTIRQFIYVSPTVSTFPYLERFESNDGSFFTTSNYSNWKWGATDAQTRTLLDRSANGLKSWFTGLTSVYKQNDSSFLYSPCFDLSSLTQPVLSFSHFSNQEDNCDCDYHTVEYTTNNGLTWNRLGTVNGGTNWFDSSILAWRTNITRWHVSSADIPTNASSVRFRFLFSSDGFGQGEGIGIDDIHIGEKATIYTGANTTVTETVSGNNWIDFQSGGRLIASILPAGQNLGATDVKVFINTGTIRNASNQYYLNRNLVIRPTLAPTDSVTVRFYFTEQEAVDLISASGCGTCTSLEDAYLAGITKFSGNAGNENGTLMDNSGGVHSFILPANVDIVPFNNGYYAQFKTKTFSEFWINGGGLNADQPLPVYALRFDGKADQSNALLNWNTTGEINSKQFEIERKLDNEDEFTQIGTVVATGNSSISRYYSFTDYNVFLKGKDVQYRLKLVDNNNTFTYSSIVSLSTSSNPVFIRSVTQTAGEQIYVRAGNKGAVKQIQIRILNTMGQVVFAEQNHYKDVLIDINFLKQGLYFVEIKGSEAQDFFIQKIIKL